ncbi:MAG: plasmid pRiA4b ORF-3 family protein [Barnesiella sp.]|nr:plasmid pRiA4b ORF-3 family protein [Bacteroidales bacterium]MBD5246353.1 plasmid pRiA4b ORF-3 family protein [Barnesiella sp.]MBD5249225.1 plasmid pRiA4b ORF-3 family protein [Barnesiella sp.]
MIFNFRVVSDEVDNFRREIQIDTTATFLDLKNAICDSVGFDKNEMCSFFICDEGWEKEKEITLEDMGTDSDQDAYLMDETVLEDFIDDEGQRLLFTFDYLSDRSFFIEMNEIIPRRNLKDPVCTLAKGNPPAQLTDINDIDIAPVAKTVIPPVEDLGEEFYGSDEYNDDEFDADGFDEINDMENL